MTKTNKNEALYEFWIFQQIFFGSLFRRIGKRKVIYSIVRRLGRP